MGAQEIQVRSTTPTRSGAGVDRVLSGTPDGALYAASYWDLLAMQGREYIASDAAASDLLLGSTSFATTTPMLLLRVPTGRVAIPSLLNLCQGGTVAGGPVTVIIEYDNADRWSSGGTIETVLPSRTDNPLTQGCTLYSLPTATDAYGVRVWGALIGQDVSPAEAAVNGIWLSRRQGTLPMAYLYGPASWLVHAYPSTSTAPSFFWSIGWFELPSSDLPS